MMEVYKEYRYERTQEALRIYIPKRHKYRIEGLKSLRGSMWSKIKVNAEDCTVSIIPISMLFKGCNNLTEVLFPSFDSFLVNSADEAKQVLDEIDLLLNPEGFYE